MKRVGITMTLIGMTGLLLSLLVCPAGAQTDATTPQTTASAPTFGAPPSLLATAARIVDLLHQHKFAEARAICQQGYDSATDDATRALALRAMGETYKEENASDKAIELFQQVITQYPQSDQVSWAKLGVAECYLDKAEKGHPEDNIAIALPMLQQFLTDYPNHERAEWALKYRGLCYERLGNDQAALAEYLKAADLYPKNSWTDGCLMRAIRLQQKLGRWDDAIASAQRYVTMFPDRGPARAQVSIGVSDAGKGDLAGAITQFDKVVSLYPTAKGQCAKALFQKGLAQKALGQLAAAVQTFQQLQQTHPDDYFASQAQQQLDALAAQ